MMYVGSSEIAKRRNGGAVQDKGEEILEILGWWAIRLIQNATYRGAMIPSP